MSRTLDRSQGKFEAMPVSDGAPIVESGSNADGEWTRWADGTQICSNIFNEDGVAVTVSAPGTTGIKKSAFHGSYNFPVPFISNPALSCAVDDPSGDDGPIFQVKWSHGSEGISLLYEFWATQSITSTTEFKHDLISHGRWK